MKFRVLTIWGIAALSCLTGCEPHRRVVKESFPTFRQYADRKPQSTDPLDAAAEAGWAIELLRIEGSGRLAEAQNWTRKLQHQSVLPQIWYEDAGGAITLYSGRFRAPANPDAQFAVKQAQAFELEDEVPFVNARLVPLVGGHHVAIDPHDLQQYVGFFTLQIAVFTRDYPGDRKEAAEKRALELRAQNEEAYFYHGPNSSSVTIGLFTHDDFARDGQTDVYGPRIRDLQKRFPYNVVNGEPPAEPTATTSPQTSSLVRVL